MHPSQHSPRPSSHKGAAIVELVVTLPFVLATCWMLVEFGVAYVNASVTANAARAGALAIARGDDPAPAANLALRSLILWNDSDGSRICPATPSDADKLRCVQSGNEYRITYDFDYYLLDSINKLMKLSAAGQALSTPVIFPARLTD